METWAIMQGVYFVVTGAWPLVSIRTFQLVTGPKTDLWLVKTVGALVIVIGSVILLAGIFGRVDFAVFHLAVGTAFALLFVDVNYVSKRVISKIYLLDAVVEVVLIAGWMVWLVCA